MASGKKGKRNGAEQRGLHPPGVLQVWQAKELRERVFGSVARKGVSSQFLGSVASKQLSGERSFDSLRSLRTRILIGCSFFGSVARKELRKQDVDEKAVES